VVVNRGLQKKTQKTPPSGIRLAESSRYASYLVGQDYKITFIDMDYRAKVTWRFGFSELAAFQNPAALKPVI